MLHSRRYWMQPLSELSPVLCSEPWGWQSCWGGCTGRWCYCLWCPPSCSHWWPNDHFHSGYSPRRHRTLSALAQGSLTVGKINRFELVVLMLRNDHPKLSYGGLSWGHGELLKENPEAQDCVQDSGLFHTHSSIPPGLTCWKMKVTGELRFCVLLRLIKADTIFDSRMGEISCLKTICISCRTIASSVSRTKETLASKFLIPGVETRPTTIGPAGQEQSWHLGVPNMTSSLDGLFHFASHIPQF